MICTPTYRNRVENKARADEGRGVYWEGRAVYQYIYEDKTNSRFIPVFLGNELDNESFPITLRGYTNYGVRQFDLSDLGFEALYRELTAQPAVIKRSLGDKAGPGTDIAAAPPGLCATAGAPRSDHF